MALAWGTMHHFPDPRVPLAEARRVLARGGLFYFDGEPVRRLLSLNLRATRSLQGMNPIARVLLRLRILPWLFAIDGREAMDEGALEMKFTALQWRRFVPALFERVQFRWGPYLTADMRSVSAPAWAAFRALLGEEIACKVVTAFFGGVVSGEAFKLPPLAARMVPAGPGEVRVVIRKPRGNDRLLLRAPGAATPVVRVGTETLARGPDAEESVHVFRLPAYQAAGSVTEVVVAGLADARALASIETDGPAGRVPAPIGDATPRPPFDGDLESLLACPSCRVPPASPFAEEDRPALTRTGGGYRCVACGTEYPIVDGVAVLLRPDLARRLGVLP